MTATIFKMYAPSADEELLRGISLIKHETKVVIWTDWNGKVDGLNYYSVFNKMY